jgi:K+-sensing histidine kinase KdpD
VSKVNSSMKGYLFAVVGVGVVTSALAPYHDKINSTTVALAFLVVVLFAATYWGGRPAMIASLLSLLCFNFFFLPPVRTVTIADPQNWVALTAFLVTAFLAAKLSARARERAEEAEARRLEIERLYHEFQIASRRAGQAESFEQSERLKSALLDAVTHDLRTPLTSIKASVTTLLAEVDGSEPVALDRESRREFLEVINEETDRLNRYVENLVELARIEAGAIQLRRRWSSIEEIVLMARELAEGLMRGHELTTVIARELPSVRVDANAIAEVLFSLIDNATKYSPPGTPIKITADRNEGDMIKVAVEDQGHGIPPELRERVFDKFFRATGEGALRLDQPKGLGMGLSIARGIIAAHDGRIWIESGQSGSGTRVIFSIPIGDDEVTENTEGNERIFTHSGSGR